jgi:glycosyltransferase involved in cell wall biosynthesis
LKPRIAVYIPSFSDGGVERNMVILASGFAALGYPTDFLVSAKHDLPYLQHLSPAVRLLHLPKNRRRQAEETVAYLRRERPAIMMSAKGKDDRLAIKARDVANVGTRVFLRCGIHLSSRPKMSGRNPLRRWWHRRDIQRLYAGTDGVVCVSDGVADDLAEVTGLDRASITVVRNPTLLPDFELLGRVPNEHPWFTPGQPPVILGAGSLATVKRFDDLIRAAAGVMAEVDCRLVILGEGKERAHLLHLVTQLGIAERVALPGFVSNVLPYMRDAAVFVLSSEREGSPNVLTEALACGTPSVATDCPSGPREILAGGRYGPLVTIGDVDAMRQSILDVLRHPLPAETLREAVADYTLERACTGYLRAFGLLPA